MEEINKMLWCITHTLLSAKFPISHEVYFIGEVHRHCELDQEVDAKSVAALRHYRTTWRYTKDNNYVQIWTTNTSSKNTYISLCATPPPPMPHAEWFLNGKRKILFYYFTKTEFQER